MKYIVRKYLEKVKYEDSFSENDLDVINSIFFSKHTHIIPSIKRIELIEVNDKGIEKIIKTRKNENSNSKQKRKERI